MLEVSSRFENKHGDWIGCLSSLSLDPGEGEEYDNDEEEKQEEDASIENRWAGLSLDDATLGAYDHVVRCWKCRAGLKINIEIYLKM